MKPLSGVIGRFVRRENGPLTAELVREPGAFGLGQVPQKVAPDSTATMVCGFCSTGCALKIHMKDGVAVNLTPEVEYPVNLGMACPKGWEALTPLVAADRATRPLMRRKRQAKLDVVSWDQALKAMCDRFRSLKERHGPESCAFLSTGQITTEEMTFLGALWKFGMGFIHCDSNTRQCMATSHVAYKESFGFDAPPYTYADFEESDVLVFVGSNPCIAHPIMWQRVMRNRNRPKIIVVDPRRTETAMAATQHYAIRPKSDLVLLYGLANILAASGWVDREFIAQHTRGFNEFTRFVAEFTTDRVCAETGLAPEQLWQFAETIAQGKRVSFWWTMGVNQGYESTRTAQAIINIALMTGNIGRRGTGANSITGQCNAMGSRLFSNITSLLGGHDADSEADRRKIARILGIDETQIPRDRSHSYHQIIEGVREGRIKGLWIIGTNSAHSWIEQRELKEVLGQLEFLVVQDMYHDTETAKCADLILPAAGWGEKEGSFINSERRIGVIKKVAKAPEEALADFSIFRLVAHYWGCGEIFARWRHPEAVFKSLAEISRGQPCDFSAISGYAMIEEAGGIQWPCSNAQDAAVAERRLFEDGRFYHPDGRARFCFEAPRSCPEPVDATFDLALLTGRGSSAQWHTGTRTEKSQVLQKLGPRRLYLEIHPEDATARRLKDRERVIVESRRGRIEAIAFVTPTVPVGAVFLPMHFREVNMLTLGVFDPYSHQPSYKHCAVRVSPARGRR